MCLGVKNATFCPYTHQLFLLVEWIETGVLPSFLSLCENTVSSYFLFFCLFSSWVLSRGGLKDRTWFCSADRCPDLLSALPRLGGPLRNRGQGFDRVSHLQLVSKRRHSADAMNHNAGEKCICPKAIISNQKPHHRYAM